MNQEHVDRKLGNTKGWLGFPLTPIHFDLNRTCTDVCNEVSRMKFKAFCILGFVRCMFVTLYRDYDSNVVA